MARKKQNAGFFERLRGPSTISYRAEIARRRKAAERERKREAQRRKIQAARDKAIERQQVRDAAKRARLEVAEANRVKRELLRDEARERERERQQARRQMSAEAKEQERIFRQVQREERAEKRARKKEREREGLGPGYDFDLNPTGKKRRGKKRRNASAFDRCVAKVSKRPGVKSPRGVCAAAGRAKYGQAEMTRRAIAGKKKAARRRGRNPEEGAAAMYEKFHGRPASRVKEYQESVREHSWLAELGRLVYLIVKVGPGRGKLLDNFKGVEVACSENGGQIYFVGGDAAIDLRQVGAARELPKDHVEIGPCVEICYHTKKGFHNFEPIDYYHKFGKPGGFPPTLNYDVLNQRPYLSGGSYQVKPEGIVN